MGLKPHVNRSCPADQHSLELSTPESLSQPIPYAPWVPHSRGMLGGRENPCQCESDRPHAAPSATRRAQVLTCGSHSCPGCALTAQLCQRHLAVPSRDQPALANSKALQDPSSTSNSSTRIPDNQPALASPAQPHMVLPRVSPSQAHSRPSCPMNSSLPSWLIPASCCPGKHPGPHRPRTSASLPSQSLPPGKVSANCL